MHIGKNNPEHKYIINSGINTHELDITKSEKDLGVFIDPNLNFEDHITNTVSKARRTAGLLSRTITYKSKDIMVPLFKSLVNQTSLAVASCMIVHSFPVTNLFQ